jgi:hypothetical protein
MRYWKRASQSSAYSRPAWKRSRNGILSDEELFHCSVQDTIGAVFAGALGTDDNRHVNIEQENEEDEQDGGIDSELEDALEKSL